MNEIKVVPSISITVPIIANNLIESTKENPKFKQMDYGITQLSRIFFGMDQGILIANDRTKIMPDVLQTKNWCSRCI